MAIQISISNAIGSRYRGSVVPPIDPDAQAFITAAAITDPTQQAAINTLVVDLKGYNIWTKFSALYPMVGGTNSKHSWNLKNTAQYQISWQGGVTSSANGIQFNGTNSYGITGYNPSVNGSLNSHHFSFYSRTNSNGTEIEAGLIDANGITNTLEIRTSGITYIAVNSGATWTTFSDSDSRAFYLANRTASNVVNAWRNSTKAATGTTASTALPNGDHWLGAWNNIANPNFLYYSTKQCAFASIGDGLTDAEAANFYTAVQTFQVTLGRSIGTQSVSDADAQAFVTNAGIVDQVEANAVNNLVIGLKADGLWTKMKAVYPFVGGTSTSNSYNLRNTAQYQITWQGGVISSANGVQFNGMNSYGITGFVPSSNLTLTSGHLSVYVRTNASGGYDMGSVSPSPFPENMLISRYSDNNFYVKYGSTYLTTSNTDSRGSYITNRNSATNTTGFKNGIRVINAVETARLSTLGLFIGANNNGGSASEYSPRQLAFASIGDGLSDTDATNFYNRVQTFNTALARQV